MMHHQNVVRLLPWHQSAVGLWGREVITLTSICCCVVRSWGCEVVRSLPWHLSAVALWGREVVRSITLTSICCCVVGSWGCEIVRSLPWRLSAVVLWGREVVRSLPWHLSAVVLWGREVVRSWGHYLDIYLLLRCEVVVESDRECLLAGQVEGVCRLARQVLQWYDAHTNEVTAMDALVALRDHRLDALYTRTHALSTSHDQLQLGKV